MTLTIDRNFLIDTLTQLVRINSINPGLSEGGPGEAQAAAFTAGILQSLGLEVTTYALAPTRVNVLGRLAGRGEKALMLNGHLDTVGVDEMPDPFGAVIRDGKMYGRGTYDMKGAVAAILAATKAIVDSGETLGGDLLVAAVADEEFNSIGTRDILKHCRVDAAIVAEPTELDLCLAHRGFVWLEVETRGRAEHGSRYDLGIDANMHMGRVLGELETLGEVLLASDGHPLVGPPSLHASTLRGGTELSMYADRCVLQVERRTIPGETDDQVLAEVQAMLDRLAAADPQFDASVRIIGGNAPFEAQADSPVVQAVDATMTAVLGRRPARVGHAAWLDSAILGAAGVDTVIVGPRGAGAHAHEEWVELDSLVTLAEVLARSAVAYLG